MLHISLAVYLVPPHTTYLLLYPSILPIESKLYAYIHYVNVKEKGKN